MPYFQPEFPTVSPTLDDRRFWDNCANRRLAFQSCGRCNQVRHPPTPICPKCQSGEINWIDAPHEGRIFTFMIARHSAHPAAAASLPYNVVVVDFPDLPGARLVSNVLDAGPDELFVGATLVLAWDQGSDGQLLPRFRLKSCP